MIAIVMTIPDQAKPRTVDLHKVMTNHWRQGWATTFREAKHAAIVALRSN
jgi:hypothetical protein